MTRGGRRLVTKSFGFFILRSGLSLNGRTGYEIKIFLLKTILNHEKKVFKEIGKRLDLLSLDIRK